MESANGTGSSAHNPSTLKSQYRHHYEMLKQGTFILENCGIARAVDLNGFDHRSVIAHPKHGWANQQWRFTKLGEGWAISSALKPIGEGFVLPLLGSRTEIGYDMTTSKFPSSWQVKPAEQPGLKGEGTEGIYQIQWPLSDFVLEINANETETKLNLGPIFAGPVEESAHQFWKFILCEEELAIETLIPKSDVGYESDDSFSTTTTTTTTVTTTSTKRGKQKDDFVAVDL